MRTTLLTIVFVTLVAMATATEALAAKKVEVMLRGHDQAITGFLREVGQTRYMLQGQDRFYEFEAAELLAVNGQPAPSAQDLGQGRLIYTTLYEKILPGGDVEVWSSLAVENSGTTLIESIDWGAAEWEREQIRTMEVRDPFGNLLPVSITPRDGGGYKVKVDLPVPVVPMESTSLSVKVLRRGIAKRTDTGGWTYTFNVDFNEDRFFVRKVELPAGARVQVPAGWWRSERAGRVFLHSYFYYPAHTKAPQVIAYRLD